MCHHDLPQKRHQVIPKISVEKQRHVRGDGEVPYVSELGNSDDRASDVVLGLAALQAS